MDTELSLFAINASRDLGEKVASELGVSLSQHEERDFVDGEHKSRPLENIRGRDVFVFHSLYSDRQQSVNDKLVRLLLFLGAVRDASAARVTAVIPYLCYSRKDRKTKSRDPVSTRYIAAMLEAVGIDSLVTLDVHNLAAYQNAYRIRAEHLEASKLFIEHFATQIIDEPVVVISPDVGGVKRAELFRQALETRLGRPIDGGFMEKQRSAGLVSGDKLVADVKDRAVIVIDDLISSGGTIARTVKSCSEAGAVRIFAAASHGLFVSDANKVLADPALDQLIITDTLPPFRLVSEAIRNKLVVLKSASLFAGAIRCIHEGGSIVELLEN